MSLEQSQSSLSQMLQREDVLLVQDGTVSRTTTGLTANRGNHAEFGYFKHL